MEHSRKAGIRFMNPQSLVLEQSLYYGPISWE